MVDKAHQDGFSGSDMKWYSTAHIHTAKSLSPQKTGSLASSGGVLSCLAFGNCPLTLALVFCAPALPHKL